MTSIQKHTYVHPWHDLSVGTDVPRIVNSIVEITKGTKAKYELDKETGLLRLDRILATHLTYPVHYGFIPQTYCDDNDPLDVLIICNEPLLPLSIVESTVLGSICMVDGGEQDDKIIAVATHDPVFKKAKTLDDIDKELLESIRYFFQNYKKPENKIVTVERFLPKEEAWNVVEAGIMLYKKTFTNNK